MAKCFPVIFPVSTVIYAEDSVSHTEKADITNSENSDIISTQSERGVNETTDELVDLINSTVLEYSGYAVNQGTWDNESKQSENLIDLKYHGSGNIYGNSDYTPNNYYDNLDFHMTYNEAENVMIVSQSVGAKCGNDDKYTVAYTSKRCWNVFCKVLYTVKDAIGIDDVTRIDLIFDEGITEVGYMYFNSSSFIGGGIRNIIFPESCVRIDGWAFYYLPYPKKGNYYKDINVIISSDKMEYIGVCAFGGRPLYSPDVNNDPLNASVIVDMPVQTGNCKIDGSAIYGAICNYSKHANATSIFGNYGGLCERLRNSANRNVAFLSNVTLSTNAIDKCPIVIFDKNITMDTGNSGSPFSYYKNIVIFTGENPLSKKNAFRNFGDSVICFYPSSCASSYCVNGFSVDELNMLYPYDCSIDELLENLETYYKKALAAKNNKSSDDESDYLDYTPGETVSSDTGYITNTVSEVQYTGKKIKINSVISIKTPEGMTITGKELVVKCKNSKNVGTATYTIKGVKGKRFDKEFKKAIKAEYADKTFTFEVVARQLNSANIEIKTKKDGSIGSVKWINGTKKKTVPKKSWTLNGTTLTFSGNFTGEVDVSKYVGSSSSASTNSVL